MDVLPGRYVFCIGVAAFGGAPLAAPPWRCRLPMSPLSVCPPALQVITSSHDKTVRLWDLRMGKTLATLTHHKKVGLLRVGSCQGAAWVGGAGYCAVPGWHINSSF